MAGFELGTAFVRVVADTSGLRSSASNAAGQAGNAAGQSFSQRFDANMRKGAMASAALVGGLAGKVFSDAMSQQAGRAKLEAKLGISPAQAAALSKVSAKVYADNWGESLGDVNDAVVTIKQSFKGLNDNALEGITKKAMAFNDTFGTETPEVVNAVSQMLKTGLAKNADQAFDVLTKGFQSGANKADDLLDTFNEYGTQFRKLGIDGPQALGLINQMIRAGARDSDLAADAIKEFSIRAVDGSKTTVDGFKSLGLNVKRTTKAIAQGGPAANRMFGIVVNRLKAIKNPAERSRIAVELFGTQSEDLGKALYAIDPAAAKAAKGIDKVDGASTRMTDAAGRTASPIDILKRQFESWAQSVATKLLPLVKGVTNFVNNLSDGQKRALTYVAGIVLAMGPVYMIGSKLMALGTTVGRAVSAISGGFSRMTGATSAAALNTQRNMLRLSAAIGGIAIGTAVGQLTKNSSSGVKALGALGSAAAGAAMGFSMGGPWGAAIGGTLGGLSSLVSSFGDNGEAAQKASRKAAEALAGQREAAQNLLTTLQQVNGAYGKQTRDATAQQLEKSGALKAAQKAGIDPAKYTDLVLSGQAMAQINRMFDGPRTKGGEANWTKLYDLTQQAQDGAADAEASYQRLNAAAKKALIPSDQLGVSTKKLGAALKGTGRELQYNVKAQIHRNGKFYEGMVLTNRNNAYAKRNNAVIKENTDALAANAVKQLAHGRGVKRVLDRYRDQISTLKTNLKQMGFNGKAVDQIVGKYARVPKSVITQMEKRGVKPADIQAILNKYGLVPAQKRTTLTVVDKFSSQVATLRRQLHNLPASVGVSVNAVGQVAVKGGGRYASGGYIRGAGTGTSDSIHAKLSNGEFVVRASQTRKHLPLLRAINNGARGFAKGGLVGNSAKIANYLMSELGLTARQAAGFLGNFKIESGFSTKAHNPREGAIGLAQWEGGRRTALQNYASNHNLRETDLSAQLGFLKKELKGGYRGVLNRVKGMSNPAQIAALIDAQYEVSSGNARGARMSAATSLYNQMKRGGISTSTAAQTPAEKKAAAALKKQKGLLVRIEGKDTLAVLKNLFGDVKTLNAATKTLLKNVAAAVSGGTGSTKLLKRLANDVKRLNDYAKRRADIQKKLADLKTDLQAQLEGYAELKGSVRSAIVGTFDIGSAGSDGSVGSMDRLLASLKNNVASAKKFAAELTRLKRLGLNGTLLSQLGQAGPDSANAQALAGASKSQIDQINKLYGSLAGYGNSGGTTVAGVIYDKKIAADRAAITSNTNSLKSVERSIKGLGKDINKLTHSGAFKPTKAGDTYRIDKIEISVKEMKEIQQAVDFFGKVKKTARAGTGKKKK